MVNQLTDDGARMTTLTFLILSLAVWRVSSLVVHEAGPFDMFIKIREFFGIQHDNGIPYMIPSTFIAGVISCVWCFSIWLSVLWVILWFTSPDFIFYVSLPLAFSGFAIMVETLTRH